MPTPDSHLRCALWFFILICLLGTCMGGEPRGEPPLAPGIGVPFLGLGLGSIFWHLLPSCACRAGPGSVGFAGFEKV